MVQMTENAKIAVKRLIETENKPGAFFRVGVKEGCCEDFTYDYKVDSNMANDDRVFQIDDLKVICDAKSLPFLDGMAIDYCKDDPKGVFFKFINPNATDSCGCGASFSV